MWNWICVCNCACEAGEQCGVHTNVSSRSNRGRSCAFFFFLDEGAFLDHTPPSSSGAEGEGGAAETVPVSSGPVAALAPSLTPASQPTISLLTDSSSDSLSVESLTLLPPADSPHLYPCTRYSSISQNLPRGEVFITEEEEGGGSGDEREEGGDEGWLDETEADTTVKEVTTELVTPTEEEPEGQENTAEKEETGTELLPAQQTEMHSEAIDSPELD